MQIVAHKTVDWKMVHENKNIITLITNRGGHVQWHAGLSPTGFTYADAATHKFLSSVLELQAQSRCIKTFAKPTLYLRVCVCVRVLLFLFFELTPSTVMCVGLSHSFMPDILWTSCKERLSN